LIGFNEQTAGSKGPQRKGASLEEKQGDDDEGRFEASDIRGGRQG